MNTIRQEKPPSKASNLVENQQNNSRKITKCREKKSFKKNFRLKVDKFAQIISICMVG